MNYKYSVAVLELIEVHEIPNAWTTDKFKQLLHAIEFEDIDDIPEAELKEMTAMALSDFELEEAAEYVLEFVLDDKLNKGQRQNIATEIRSDKIWEEYAEIKFHEALFNVCCMIYWAFPKKFPEPDIAKIKLSIKSLSKEAETNVKTPSASFIARLLTDGMDEHNSIYRLFDDNLTSNTFSEAEDIIWSFEVNSYNQDDHSCEITLYTSWNWVDELKGVRSFDSTAFSDGQLH